MSRDIDALVAEHVLGCKPEQWLAHVFPPPYSTDLAAAWTVVEQRHLTVSPTDDARWAAGSLLELDDSSWTWTFYVEADTAPLAICLVALQMVGVEVPV